MRSLKLPLSLGGIALGVVTARRLLQPPARRHQSETEADYRAAGHRVLILGGGFGGATTARALDRALGDHDNVSILVVDRDNDLLFQPLLWTVADGRVNPNHVTVPLRTLQRRHRFHLLHADVEHIDLDAKEVQTSAGRRPYDTLVIALGSVTAIPDLPGLREHARRFATPGDAIELRNHLIDAVESAHQTMDPAERAAWLTFVVGGGGDTGIELAAVIHEYLTSGLLRAYPWLAREAPRIIVAGRADRLLPMSTPRTSQAVADLLERQGIEVLTGTAIESATAETVSTSAGPIPARTLFWAAGISATAPVRALPVEHARNGAIVVDERLRIPTHPDVYVLGDSAWAFSHEDGAGVPPTAQAAQHQGAYLGHVLANRLNGDREAPEPFTFKPKGRLALLTRRTGVAEIGPWVITGLPAWAMWHGYYVSQIPSWRNRIRLGVDFALAALTGRETTTLRLNPPPRRDVTPSDESGNSSIDHL